MSFHRISKECFDWLKSQPKVKEESLTDWFLYQLDKRVPNVISKTFTRNEEAKNGSDWEWWFLTNDSYDRRLRAYRFLVQAKKLKSDTYEDNYPLIAYANRNGLQIDLLTQEALYRRAMPLYIYYTVQQPDIEEQLKNIDYLTEKELRWCSTCVNGCFLSSAFSVKDFVFDSPRRKIESKELVDRAFGLSIFDLVLKDAANADRLLKQFNQAFLEERRKEDMQLGGITYYGKEIPSYVVRLCESKENPDFSQEQYRELAGLSGIAVFDLRD
ncbi:MAG: hypothetical protein IJX98_05700 [Clostridia bacterium]|nr:hypothetical protein [Clostridia bacterium]